MLAPETHQHHFELGCLLNLADLSVSFSKGTVPETFTGLDVFTDFSSIQTTVAFLVVPSYHRIKSDFHKRLSAIYPD
jgi:hypothetical protein